MPSFIHHSANLTLPRAKTNAIKCEWRATIVSHRIIGLTWFVVVSATFGMNYHVITFIYF